MQNNTGNNYIDAVSPLMRDVMSAKKNQYGKIKKSSRNLLFYMFFHWSTLKMMKKCVHLKNIVQDVILEKFDILSFS